MEKKKHTTQKIILVILVILLATGIYVRYRSAKPTAEPAETPENELSITGYAYYKPEDMDFNFVIADLTITVDQPANLKLSQLTTDENIALDKTQTYQDQLKGTYNLSTLKISDKLDTTKKDQTVRLFLPVLDPEKKTLTVTSAIPDTDSLIFDLAIEPNDLTSFKIQEPAPETPVTEPVKEEQPAWTIAQVLEVTGTDLTENGSAYSLPSTARIFAVAIQSENTNDIITGAELTIPEKSNVPAVERTVVCEEYPNAVGMTFKNDKAYLLFPVLDGERKIALSSGTVTIHFEQGEDITLSF